MKNLFILSLAFFSCSVVFSQAPANATVYDCNGNSKNIYSTLATGKSIIVAHKGVDCSICMNSAPGWQTWAAANTNEVEVWGAITYTYNPNQFSNMCQKTQNWKSTYNWNDIFTFPDSSRDWVNGGSPRYYVYSAIDSSIVYQGPNSGTARSMALAQTTVGINDLILRNSTIFFDSKNLRMENLDDKVRTFSIFNSQGQLIKEGVITNKSETVDVSEYGTGLFVVQFRTNDNKTESRKIVFY